jgi:hypothetical protein
MSLHWAAAPGQMGELLRAISQSLTESDFYLAGGTALALLEGHRISVDIDLFSASFEDPGRLLSTVEQAFPDAVTTLVAPRTLYLRIAGTSVSFLGYDYESVAPQLKPDPELLPFASREDIAAMKLAAIASRGSRKDFVDLWWLATRHWPLSECLELYQKKYASRDIGHVVRSLTYFDDAEEEPPLRLLAEIDWETVKRDLSTWVAEIVEAGGD